jgi:hypothetical protein
MRHKAADVAPVCVTAGAFGPTIAWQTRGGLKTPTSMRALFLLCSEAEKGYAWAH